MTGDGVKRVSLAGAGALMWRRAVAATDAASCITICNWRRVASRHNAAGVNVLRNAICICSTLYHLKPTRSEVNHMLPNAMPNGRDSRRGRNCSTEK